MEQIYTIPVNEAFEAAAADHSLGCPICALYNRLEENELDLILGASMMESDVRIQTNKEGFCRTHYDMMMGRKNRLGMALTLESHLDELRGQIKLGTLMPTDPAGRAVGRIGSLEDSCYVCRRIDYHFQRMTDTVVLLWDSDESFPEKLRGQPYFCLPHYRLLLTHARARLQKKKYAAFARECAGVVEPYCKKFDYRYADEPWNNSRDAVERAIKFLRADLHTPPAGRKDKQ